MPFFKEVWVFSLGNNSWTEVYYSEAGTIGVASQFSTAFLNARLALLHDEGVLVKIRISDVLNVRATVLTNIGRAGKGAGFGGPDVTNTAAVITLNSTAVPSNRQLWMRGLPDDLVVRTAIGANDDPPEYFRTSLRTWLQALRNNQYQVRSLSRLAVPPVAPNVYSSIASVTPSAGKPGFSDLAIVGAYSGTSGRIIISQCSPKLLPGINGHWDVVVIDANTLRIRYNSPQSVAIPITKGRLRPEIYAYGLINNETSSFNFFRSRKTGKSFLGGRGRKTGVRLRSL